MVCGIFPGGGGLCGTPLPSPWCDPWSDLLFYTTNKALAIGSAAALSAVLAFRPLAELGWQVHPSLMAARPGLGRLALIAACLHAIISYSLLGPDHYPKFFSSGQSLNAMGRWSLVFGWLSLSVYWIYHLHRQRNRNSRGRESPSAQWAGFALLLMVALHATIMGLRVWLTPESWLGGLPPITPVVGGIPGGRRNCCGSCDLPGPLTRPPAIRRIIHLPRFA
jgi:hypothetical protein